MKWGDKYHAGYVTKLIHDIKFKLSIPNKIFLYTDKPEGLEKYVDIIDIGDFPYNFNRRVNLFRKGFSKGLNLVCDLDIKIIKDFSKFINVKKGIKCIKAHWKDINQYKGIYGKEYRKDMDLKIDEYYDYTYKTTINGSLTCWNGDDPLVHEIYDHFMENPEMYSEKYWGHIDRFIEWEHLNYTTFENEIAFSHSLGPYGYDGQYCVELFHRGDYENTLH